MRFSSGWGALRFDISARGITSALKKKNLSSKPAEALGLKRYTLAEKEPQLFKIDDFSLSALPPEVEFDFMLAQSVFTHLTPELIELCVKRVELCVKRVMIINLTQGLNSSILVL